MPNVGLELMTPRSRLLTEPARHPEVIFKSGMQILDNIINTKSCVSIYVLSVFS